MAELVFSGDYPVTQPFGAQADLEPPGFRASDGSINYRGDGEPGHWHNGTDFGLPCGTPLKSPWDGLVIQSGLSPTGFGERVMIGRTDGLAVLLGHMSRLDVGTGNPARAGEVVGLSGNTGNSTGCHLHVSVIRPDGSYIDPTPYIQDKTRPPAPSDASGIVWASFTVRSAPGTSRVWDGPGERFHTMKSLGGGIALACDAWMRAAPKWDDGAGQWDRRWYHTMAGGWISSARVLGNAPNSQP